MSPVPLAVVQEAPPDAVQSQPNLRVRYNQIIRSQRKRLDVPVGARNVVQTSLMVTVPPFEGPCGGKIEKEAKKKRR